MNLPIGRRTEGPNDRMEAELAAWLRGLQPAGTPIALRLGTFADLRAEAERRRGRLPWLVPALSSLGSLAAIVLVLGLIVTLLALAGPRLGSAPGSAVQPIPGSAGLPPDEASGTSHMDPAALAVLILASCLAGMAVLQRRVCSAANRLAFGTDRTVPVAPLPLRRPWRSIPRLTRALGVLTVAAVALTVWEYFAIPFWTPPGADIAVGVLLLSEIVAVPLALVVAWRYPRRDRSARLLLLWASIELAIQLYFLTAIYFGTLWAVWGATAVIEVLSTLAAVALAAGLAGRSGSFRRPPVRLAAVAVGAGFALSMYLPIQWSFIVVSWVDPTALTPWLLSGAENWIVLSAWAAILWVALGTFRQGHRSWAWGAVLVASVLQLSWRLCGYLFGFWDFSQLLGQWTSLMTLLYSCQVFAMAVAGTAMLAALLGGLRPVPPVPPQDAPLPAEPAPAGNATGR
jgi:hypothetical protein